MEGIIWRYSTITQEAPSQSSTVKQEAQWQYCRKSNWQQLYDSYLTEFILWRVDHVYRAIKKKRQNDHKSIIF